MTGIMGKTILVTGVASGIGLETARELIKAGARVVGVDRNEAPSDLALDGFYRIDLAKREEIHSLATAVGAVDALVNVAGVPSSQPWELQFRVNFLGTREMVRVFKPNLREHGAVVNVASGTGLNWLQSREYFGELVKTPDYDSGQLWLQRNPQEGLHSYSRSKEALIIWTVREACDWVGSGLRLNAVSPGPVDTPMLPQFRSALGDAVIDSDIERAGRAGVPSDIAPVIVFLLSPEAHWIHGENIAVDGGFAASMFSHPELPSAATI